MLGIFQRVGIRVHSFQVPVLAQRIQGQRLCYKSVSCDWEADGMKGGRRPFLIYSPRAIAFSISASSFSDLFSARGNDHTSVWTYDKHLGQRTRQEQMVLTLEKSSQFPVKVVPDASSEVTSVPFEYYLPAPRSVQGRTGDTHEGSGYSLPSLCSSLYRANTRSRVGFVAIIVL